MSKEVATMSTEQLLEVVTGLLADRVIPVEGTIVGGIDIADPRVEESLLEAERKTAAKIDWGPARASTTGSSATWASGCPHSTTPASCGPSPTRRCGPETSPPPARH